MPRSPVEGLIVPMKATSSTKRDVLGRWGTPARSRPSGPRRAAAACAGRGAAPRRRSSASAARCRAARRSPRCPICDRVIADRGQIGRQDDDGEAVAEAAQAARRHRATACRTAWSCSHNRPRPLERAKCSAWAKCLAKAGRLRSARGRKTGPRARECQARRCAPQVSGSSTITAIEVHKFIQTCIRNGTVVVPLRQRNAPNPEPVDEMLDERPAIERAIGHDRLIVMDGGKQQCGQQQRADLPSREAEKLRHRKPRNTVSSTSGASRIAGHQAKTNHSLEVPPAMAC